MFYENFFYFFKSFAGGALYEWSFCIVLVCAVIVVNQEIVTNVLGTL